MTEDVYDLKDPEVNTEKELLKSMIRINENYGIGVGSDQYTLYKICKNRKTGKESFRAYGFYATLQGALKSWLKQSVRDGLDINMEFSLTEAAERVMDIVDGCNRLIEDAFPEYKVVRERSH